MTHDKLLTVNVTTRDINCIAEGNVIKYVSKARLNRASAVESS